VGGKTLEQGRGGALLKSHWRDQKDGGREVVEKNLKGTTSTGGGEGRSCSSARTSKGKDGASAKEKSIGETVERGNSFKEIKRASRSEKKNWKDHLEKI